MCHGVWVRIHPPVFANSPDHFVVLQVCTRAKSSSAWQFDQHDLMVCFRHFVCLVQVCKKRCCSTIFGSFQDVCKLCASSRIVRFEDQRPLVPISGFSCGHIGFAKRLWVRCESGIFLSVSMWFAFLSFLFPVEPISPYDLSLRPWLTELSASQCL